MDAAIANSFEHYPLNYREYHLNVGEFRGQPLVHIRERTQRGQYTQRGIALNEEEWDDLMGLQENVQAALRDLVVQPPTAEDTWVRTIGHRGRRVVVSKYRGAGYVNIRNWWAPRPGETPRPTRIGVTLSAAAFSRLLGYEMFINDDINRLVQATEDRCQQQLALERRLAERREAIVARAAAATDAAIHHRPDNTLPPAEPRRRVRPTAAAVDSDNAHHRSGNAPPPVEAQYLPDLEGIVLPPAPKRVRLTPRPTPGPSTSVDDPQPTPGPSTAAEDPQPTPGPSQDNTASPAALVYSEAVPMDFEYLLTQNEDENDDEGATGGLAPPPGETLEEEEDEPVIVAVEGPLNPPKAKGPKTKRTPKKRQWTLGISIPRVNQIFPCEDYRVTVCCGMTAYTCVILANDMWIHLLDKPWYFDTAI